MGYRSEVTYRFAARDRQALLHSLVEENATLLFGVSAQDHDSTREQWEYLTGAITTSSCWREVGDSILVEFPNVKWYDEEPYAYPEVNAFKMTVHDIPHDFLEIGEDYAVTTDDGGRGFDEENHGELLPGSDYIQPDHPISPSMVKERLEGLSHGGDFFTVTATPGGKVFMLSATRGQYRSYVEAVAHAMRVCSDTLLAHLDDGTRLDLPYDLVRKDPEVWRAKTLLKQVGGSVFFEMTPIADDMEVYTTLDDLMDRLVSPLLDDEPTPPLYVLADTRVDFHM